MMILIVINDYLLIRVVSPYDFSGVLSMRLNGGEKSGVNYLHHGTYCLNIMTMMCLMKIRR